LAQLEEVVPVQLEQAQELAQAAHLAVVPALLFLLFLLRVVSQQVRLGSEQALELEPAQVAQVAT
jgi:hypothetical protein